MSFCATRDRRGEQGRDAADPGDDRRRLRRASGEAARLHAGHQVDAGRHHRGRVDQGRDRRRALHGVGQPDVQRELRRLADRADEQQQRDAGRRRLADHAGLGREVQVQVADRPDRLEPEEHREHEPPVADAVGDECLLAGGGRRLTLVPERDQQVRTRADALPTEERDQQVLAEDEQRHRQHEQVHVEEELRELRVAVHVPDREQVDQERDARDEQRHRDRQRIRQERHVDLQRIDRNPREQRLDVGPFLLGHGEQVGVRAGRDDERAEHHGRGEIAGERIAHATTEQQDQQKPEQGEGGDQPDDVEHALSQFLPGAAPPSPRGHPARRGRRGCRESLAAGVHPLSSARSSAVAPGRRLRIEMMMPRPTTTSAAATTRTKKTAV